MYNFKPGGGHRQERFLGGRPKSDANYAPKKRFDKGGSRSDSRPQKDVQLFKTTCTKCGKACEVPFKPDGSKPVLCRECFSNKNPAPARDGFGKRESFGERDRKPERRFDAPRANSGADLSALTSKITALESKLNEILSLVQHLKPTAISSAKVENNDSTIAESVLVPKAKKQKKAVVKKVSKKVKK
jgi:CxxC-x17-CxxC domain-containing protein